MCFRVSIKKEKQEIEKRFNLNPNEMSIFPEYYHISGFAHPKLPVICSDNDKDLVLASWGLIPFWVKKIEQAKDISYKTLNARSETIFEKPSFRESIKSKRCIIVVDGFYESFELNGKKYPYYIYMKDKNIFGLAGIWDSWLDPVSGESKRSISIITTQANSFMGKIHNTKKRMPVILPIGKEQLWLNKLSKNDICKLFIPDDSIPLKAHTVGKLIYSKTLFNGPDVQNEIIYKELT